MTASTRSGKTRPARPFGLRLLTRAAGFALLWFGLNGGDWKSWMVGGPAVLVATWVSVRLLPPTTWRWSARGALGFAGFFLRESVRGGWDVARRALAPGMPIAPGLVDYMPRLPAGTARWFFCGAISLLPGTAVVGIEADRLVVHVLDVGAASGAELRKLEDRVAALFTLALEDVAPS